ncbi:MAG: response regulator [Prevotellaceae bacterium]|jgi:signal transduction histidine kinase|nr:response regulator [Prevotellaceae bacterium]
MPAKDLNRITALLHQLADVSTILLAFLKDKDPDKVIHEILRSVLSQFQAGRAYIFEYDWEGKTQTNTYEVVDEGIEPAIDMLDHIPLEANQWWTQQILLGQEIILNTLDDLPPQAIIDKEILSMQDIKSLFVAPLLFKDGAWGYAGIDIVNEYHTWTPEDKEWLRAIINIISLCLQLQRSQQTAVAEQKYMQTLYRNMPIGYLRLKLLTDGYGKPFDFRVMDCNPVTETLLAIQLSDAIGKNISDYSMPIHDTVLKLLESSLQEGVYEGEIHIEANDKYLHYIHYYTSKNEVVALVDDRTESHHSRKQLIKAKEKAETSDKLKSAFLANMSHEIRTPLNAIVGFSDLVLEADNREEAKEYTKLIHQNSDLLLQLISDILDISKIEAGTLEIIPTNVDVNQMCREIIKYYNNRTGADLEITFEEHMEKCYIYSDKHRLTQIINNFINNALKFTESGSIKLGYRQISPTEIRFSVTDTGCGIPLKNQKDIFNRFVKLNDFATGTGLGLAICKSLVQQMHGEIGVESEVGKGSTFWFTHPYNIKYKPEKSKASAVALHERADKRESSKTDELPIMIVAEDVDSNYVLLQRILKDSYILIRARDGKEAVHLHARLKPDFILMDIKMPVMDGIEATKRIRKKDKKVPILAVSAYAFEQDIAHARKAGCNDYIAKPIKLHELQEKIKALL